MSGLSGVADELEKCPAELKAFFIAPTHPGISIIILIPTKALVGAPHYALALLFSNKRRWI